MRAYREAILADDYFVSVLREKYGALGVSERKKKIRELVRESKGNEVFIREHFPEFFAEAFSSTSSRAGDRRSV
jgi:hypothetical protein